MGRSRRSVGGLKPSGVTCFCLVPLGRSLHAWSLPLPSSAISRLSWSKDPNRKPKPKNGDAA